ncbi:HNH endonuclease [Psychrobacter sp. R86515]|uniref:HNH endonuclease n=1 Tax=Psychrobacter sp. R86515 TaxID=3093855 RepID=UPI0036D2D5A3
MQLFFHDVGLKGSARDFPKTIFSEISVEHILQNVPADLKDEMSKRLKESFPDGFCNVWGVPAGAKSVIKRLNVNDAMLLIRTTGGSGDLPALCIVKEFWREPMSELSNFLWESGHYPFVFFFKTQKIELTWSQFKEHVGYKMNFRPSGNVYRVKEADSKLSSFGNVESYIDFLINGLKISESVLQYQIDASGHASEYEEGERKLREVSYFARNPQLVKAAKDIYGYTCQACTFNFEDVYGELGKHYIECHHLNPLSERETSYRSSIDDVCVLCSNCHRMIHRPNSTLTLKQLKEQLENY